MFKFKKKYIYILLNIKLNAKLKTYCLKNVKIIFFANTFGNIVKIQINYECTYIAKVITNVLQLFFFFLVLYAI